tara:strand:+ start:2452 stop:4728 length:2277 start_codon:yes stop_codon:yes gene_type:complete
MGQGYIRNDGANNIANGNVIDAADLDGEFDAVVAAFDSTTGHTHDGTTAEGGVITVVGPAQEYVSSGTSFHPKTDDTYDLGSATNEWKDLYVDGIAYIDAVDLAGVSITATGTELNYMDGVTAAVQTQLDAKQASDADLTAIAALAKTDGNFIVGNGSAWVAESGATVRTSLGLGTAATTAASAYATAAQGTLADSAVQSNTSPTLGGLTVDGTNTEVLITEDSEGSATLRFADTQADPAQSYAIAYDTSSNKANFKINNTQRANFNSSGDYMVGPATTVSPFVIYGGNNDATKAGVGLRQTGYIAAARMNDHAMMLNRMGSDGLTMGIRNDGTFVGGLGNVGGELTFHDSTAAEAMRIDSSGSVGIGTTNPSTALDVTGTVTATSYAGDGSALTGVARKVWESSQGSGTSTNYWAKVATYSISGNYDDGSFIYHFVPEEFGAGMPAIVAVNVRRNNGSGGDNHTLNIQLLAKPHANPFSDDSFKLIDDGGATDIELWVKKNDNNGQIVMYEMSAHVEDSTFTIAYNQNAAWQSSEPTGTGLNIKTTGVKVAGNFTATAFAGDGSALTGLATAAQGALADTSVQPNDSPTFAGLTTTANVSFGDADKATFGDGNDLEIYHSGTSSYIRDVGDGDLQIFATDDVYIRGYATNNYMARFAETGAVTLYHNNSAKLATSSTGVNVTGTVTATAFAGDGSALTGIAAGATGGGNDDIFYENGQNVTTNYTITNGKNAMSAGPITIDSGVTVTVGAGETWTVV